jgi:hypothetical protein
MHDPLHALYPAAHATPHVDPLQAAEPLAGAGQAEHDDPQELTLVLERHIPLQLW